MKILLILPAGENVRVTHPQSRVPRRAMLRFSVLPLTIVAALTPREHAVRIVDENVEPLDFDTECDVVGITFMTALAPRAYEIAREFRRRGKLVVAGGYHATLCPDDAATHFDALVVGDAEGAWERVVADIGSGHLQRIYRRNPHPDPLPHTARERGATGMPSHAMGQVAGPAFGAGLPQTTAGLAHTTAPSRLTRLRGLGSPTAPSARPSGLPIHNNLGDLRSNQVRGRETGAQQVARIYRSQSVGQGLHSPIPRRDLLAHTARHYATIHAVQTGRGCRHACRYCSVTVFHGQKFRHRRVADVLAELAGVPRHFIFVDDNIIADREFALALFAAMVPLRKRWVSQCSILIADDPELLAAARAAGCRGLFIGIETVSESNLAAMNKQFNHTGSYAGRLQKIRRAGIGVIAGMIVGMDGDEVGVFERTLRFLQQTQIDAVQLNILTPLPGTPLFADMELAGRITDRDWSHYDYRHVVFRPARLTAAELQAGADWLYAQFYRLDRILGRFAHGVFTVGWLPAVLSLKLGLTYRYDNRREKIVGSNPAVTDTVANDRGRLRRETVYATQ